MSDSLSAGSGGRLTPTPTMDGAASGALKPWQFFLLAGMLGATAAVLVATGQSMASIVTLSLTVVAASMAGLGLYRLLVPFTGPAAIRPPEMIGGRARAALEREKTLVLRAIKDLEFDRSMGKVSPTDFDEMSTRLRTRAMRLMQELDGAGVHRERIDRELAERLAKLPAKTVVDNAREVRLPFGGAQGTPSESRGVKADPTIHTVGDRLCATCTTANDADARFCKTCGAKLEAAS